jgi:hypothetical protein
MKVIRIRKQKRGRVGERLDRCKKIKGRRGIDEKTVGRKKDDKEQRDRERGSWEVEKKTAGCGR